MSSALRKFDPVRDRWITEDMSVIRRDFMPMDLILKMRSNGIDACIVAQADQSEAETRFLLELASRYHKLST